MKGRLSIRASQAYGSYPLKRFRFGKVYCMSHQAGEFEGNAKAKNFSLNELSQKAFYCIKFLPSVSIHNSPYKVYSENTENGALESCKKGTSGQYSYVYYNKRAAQIIISPNQSYHEEEDWEHIGYIANEHIKEFVPKK